METEVASLQLRLMRSEDATERAILLDQLVEYETQIRLDPHGLGDNRNGSGSNDQQPLKTIQSRLRADEMILEYVLSEPQSYCLWISRNGAGVEKLSGGRATD